MIKPTANPIPLLANTHRVMAVCAAAALAFLAVGFLDESRQPVAARHADRPNPWRGLPGCLWVTDASGRHLLWGAKATDSVACADPANPAPALLDDAARPPHAAALINALQPWLGAPPHALAGVVMSPADGPRATQPMVQPRSRQLGDHVRTQGAAVELALDPQAQRSAQAIANCMTGDTPDCHLTGIPADRWAHLYEGAAMRAGGLAQVDMRGGVQVMASAHTPCYEADALAHPTKTQCPVIAHAPKQAQAWRLDNHALYGAAMPGSLIKPVIALALLRSDIGPSLLQGSGRDWLLKALKESDTPALLDKLYCKALGYGGACTRAQLLPQAAYDLGLDGHTLGGLPGSAAKPALPGARLFQQWQSGAGNSSGHWAPLVIKPTDPALRAACAVRAWSACDSEALAAQTSELWGAGNASASPLGIAQMLMRLGAAAQGEPTTMRPQLATRVVTGMGEQRQTGVVHHHIATAHAKLILQGMSLTHTTGGTAHSACVSVMGSAKACNGITWLSGKTGTPGWKHDRLTLSERSGLCERANAQPAGSPKVRAERARCKLAPVKWYAALVRDSNDPSAPWSRVVVVLAERNFVRTTGKVDSALDHGINVAAELALRHILATRPTEQIYAKPD